jgi:hypothetical protein
MLATARKGFKAAKKRVKDVFDVHGPKVMQIYNIIKKVKERKTCCRPATP